MEFPEGTWHEGGEGTVQTAGDMAPWTDRLEIEITEDGDGHRKKRHLGNIQPS